MNYDRMTSPLPQTNQDIGVSRSLAILSTSEHHQFIKPMKRIHEGHDVLQFLVSRAYSDICVFVTQLNISMCPRTNDTEDLKTIRTWELDSPHVLIPEPVRRLQEMLKTVEAIIEEAPPDKGPRRFGNTSFRKWYDILESRVSALLQEYVPSRVLSLGTSVKDELSAYFLGGFGSSQRLDYGTGHELSFLAFLGCIWKLGGFTEQMETPTDGSLERSLVLGIIEPYLRVVRRLILTYTLEPAGSHGVWGLDDHFFLSYIFGSAQYCPAITNSEPMPVEGSRQDAPNPGDIAKAAVVNVERKRNMYFSAVGFIMDVKTGPFWEHSPILFDISGVRTGWAKINKGMLKMYNGEVLSKFPVVQHFPFGSLFSWEQDPNAQPPDISVHTSNQPTSHSLLLSSEATKVPTSRPSVKDVTRAPWGGQIPKHAMVATEAPWATSTGNKSSHIGTIPSTHAPWTSGGSASLDAPTRAPWSKESSDASLPRR